MKFEINGAVGDWTSDQQIPHPGAIVNVAGLGDKKTIESLVVESGEILLKIEGFEEAIPVEAITPVEVDPRKSMDFQILNLVNGSPIGPGGLPIHENCLKDRGGYGNYDPSAKTCVTCPVVRQCFCKVTGTHPTLTVNESRKKKTSTQQGVSRTMAKQSPNPYGSGGKNIAFEVLLKFADMHKDKDEVSIPVAELVTAASAFNMEGDEAKKAHTIWWTYVEFCSNEKEKQNNKERAARYQGCVTWDSPAKCWIIRPTMILEISNKL